MATPTLPTGVAPAEDDWQVADWQAPATARLLVGPGTDVGELPAGVLTVWVRFTAAPEQPVRAAGPIFVAT
jgi:hypothetical protein